MLITLNCCFCGEETELIISIPTHWIANDIEITEAFCPKHSVINNFVENQCNGCVGSWTDCDFWRSFAYGKNHLTEDDFAGIRMGICPKRTNGSFAVKDTEFMEMDFGIPALRESGIALELAIREYWQKYSNNILSDRPIM